MKWLAEGDDTEAHLEITERAFASPGEPVIWEGRRD